MQVRPRLTLLRTQAGQSLMCCQVTLTWSRHMLRCSEPRSKRSPIMDRAQVLSDFSDALNAYGPESPEVLGYRVLYPGMARLFNTNISLHKAFKAGMFPELPGEHEAALAQVEQEKRQKATLRQWLSISPVIF